MNWVGDLSKTLESLKETSIMSEGSCDFCYDPYIWVKTSQLSCMVKVLLSV